MENKLTAGQIAAQGRDNPIAIISPYESAENALKNYFKEIEKCINTHKKMAVFKDNDFYVWVAIKREQLLSRITPTIRYYYMGVLACPRPFYDQNVYKYHRNLNAIEELWMMPDMETCGYLVKNKNILNKHEQRLLEYYKRYESGDLYRLMKTLNDEEPDSPKLKKRKES